MTDEEDRVAAAKARLGGGLDVPGDSMETETTIGEDLTNLKKKIVSLSLRERSKAFAAKIDVAGTLAAEAAREKMAKVRKVMKAWIEAEEADDEE